MGPVRIGVGTEWLLDQRAYRIVRQLAVGQFVALDVKFNTERQFSRDEILGHYARGEMTFATLPDRSPVEAPSVTHRQDVRDLTVEEKLRLHQRWSTIEPLTQLAGKPTHPDFQLRATELGRQGVAISARTLRRYWKAWYQSGGNRLALLPLTSGCGHRGLLRRDSFAQKYPILSRLIEDGIRDVYLTMARRPISAVVRRVLEDIQRTNARLAAGQALPVPRKAALARAIARRIGRMDPWEVDRQRWGRKIADRKHAPTAAQRLATRILQRVEIDHSPLKVVVGTEAGLIGQPWLTILIDYYSRMIVGFCLGFEPPSYAVLMEALRQGILPKTYAKERYAKVRGTWPCYGIPEKIVCDRGSDFISNDLEAAAFQLNIELDFNPPRTPHFKGTVESFFGGLNDQLIASLPGRTFRTWERRADYKPEKGPLLSYEALLEIIHIYLADVYSLEKHPTQPKSRLEVWEDSAAEFPPYLPATPDQLLVLLSKRVQRNLSARGIELNGMFYTSADLMGHRAELAAKNFSTDALTVRYNPWDLGAVWILDPASNQYIKAAAVDTTLQGMTEYQWKVLKRAVRERFDQPEHVLNLAESRNAIREVVENEAAKPARKKRARATRYLQQPKELATDSDEGPATDEPWIDVAVVGAPVSDADSLPATDPVTLPASNSPPFPNSIDPDDLDVGDWDVASTGPK